MSTNATPPGGRVAHPNHKGMPPEYFHGPGIGFRRTAIARFFRNTEGWSLNYGVYSGALRNLLCFGYMPTSDVRNRIWNISAAWALLLFTLPIFVLLFVVIVLDSGWPVIYKGLRLGKNRKPFNIYKFRTLKPQARSVTVTQVLPDRSALETRTGKILRKTRLYELPELWNVIKGDMNLFGPRPVRRETAELYAEQIPNYEARFSVRPGLIGHVQAFMLRRLTEKLEWSGTQSSRPGRQNQK